MFFDDVVGTAKNLSFLSYAYRPSMAMPAIAPALRPTGMWGVFAHAGSARGPGIPAIHGHKKTRRVGRVFVDSYEEFATAYPAEMDVSGRRAREVMPAAMRALVTICGWWAIEFMSRT
ncbi:MAG: hypothetical protein ABIW82_02295 [Dokdonella sp.]